MLHALHNGMLSYMPASAVAGRLKQLLSRLTKGFPHGMLLRSRVLREATPTEMFEWIESFFAALDEHTIEEWAERAQRREEVRLFSVARR